MRECILHFINHAEGIKGVDLAMRVMEKMNPHRFTSGQFYEELGKLVENGEVIRLEYVMNERKQDVKSFYLPKGSEFNP